MDGHYKFEIVQVVVIVGLIAAYFFTSPAIAEKLQSLSQNFHVIAVKPPQNPKPVTLAIARAETPSPQIDIATSTAANIDPYLEPAPMATSPVPAEPPVAFIEIIDSCGPHFEGECVNARAKPSATSTSVARLRTGVVLRVADTIQTDDGTTWYKIGFNEDLRYPGRVSGGWYVNAEYTRPFNAIDTSQLAIGQTASTTKYILVDLSEQKLYAYDGDTLFMEQKVSTGIRKTPTPRGTFTIFKKTPSRYMQGPIPGISTEYYDLPGVPWNLYFTTEGAIIHGAYWHNSFGKVYSHGCVNLPVDKAEELYNWADLGTTVTVQG